MLTPSDLQHRMQYDGLVITADPITKKVDKTTTTTNQDLGGGTCYGCARDFAPGQQAKNSDQSASTFAAGQEQKSIPVPCSFVTAPCNLHKANKRKTLP